MGSLQLSIKKPELQKARGRIAQEVQEAISKSDGRIKETSTGKLVQAANKVSVHMDPTIQAHMGNGCKNPTACDQQCATAAFGFLWPIPS